VAPLRNSPPPKDDAGYFDRLSMAVFMAGLNWKMVENKWPGFGKAFYGFSPRKVAGLNERDVQALIGDTSIVRNEKKIRSTVENAKTILQIEKEFGSFRQYIESFGRKEEKLLEDMQSRFSHVGPSTARTFLWMVGYKLTPTKEERAWMKAHPA
jgi:DNA-3-methyladenine glycosylase I